ncbi:MAG: cupin-like domain-containing protein [Pacificimonas sp.]
MHSKTSEIALRRRDWIMGVTERQRGLSQMAGGLPRMRGLSSSDFLNHFYAPGRPVVIEDELENWPARKWTRASLARKIGDAPVEIQAGRTADPEFERRKDDHKKVTSFRQFMKAIGKADAGNDAYMTAYNSAANVSALAPLQGDLGRLPKFLTDAPGMMWIGPAGTFTPLHFDLTNNLLAQITGRKTVLILPPSESGKLAHNHHVFSDVGDLTDQARVAAFPGARNARYFTVDLEPGDLLYIPIGWWHQIRSLSFSVTLTYTNFLWPNEGHESYPG